MDSLHQENGMEYQNFLQDGLFNVQDIIVMLQHVNLRNLKDITDALHVQ